MKFSVLMSIYNNDDAGFLKVAIDSIYLNQTLKPSEVIIVIDGPITEELSQVVKGFSDQYPEVFTLVPIEKNCGLGPALQTGASYCKYEYIMRMDSDDISAHDRFEKQIRYMTEHPEVDVLGTNITEFDQRLDENMRVRVVPQKHDELVKMAKKRNPMNHVSVCFKKSALERCGGYEPNNLLEDYHLWLKMISNNCVLENINESLVFVRIGNGFVRKRGSKERIIGWKILQGYMVKNKMITRSEAIANMLYIRAFVYMPNSLREFVYEKLLRKRKSYG